MSTEKHKIHWYDLGLLEEIPLRGASRVIVDDKTIGIFRTSANRVFAVDDKCPHKDGPLSQGIVHDNCVTCPLHNWVIDLVSGNATGADTGSVSRYLVKVVDGRIILSTDPLPADSNEVVVSIDGTD